MPVTVNAPGFWQSIIDGVINQSNRIPQSNGSYTFDDNGAPTKETRYSDGEPRWGITGNDGNNTQTFYPQYPNPASPEDYNRRVQRMMRDEVLSQVIPYNEGPINTDAGDPLLEAMREWMSRRR